VSSLYLPLLCSRPGPGLSIAAHVVVIAVVLVGVMHAHHSEEVIACRVLSRAHLTSQWDSLCSHRRKLDQF